ncbi:TPA: hypothetical protein QC448_004595 [Bacillus cereus]|uniref:hypothetical protein n=1 Tax=Bacillus TaxID=1386 RepID=UPI000DCA4C4F|nr:hypothetical protein [Bacillus thuringiensis]RAS90259.1 hypothetical protein A6E21_26130 [Bacillus cereus]HDR8128708.1 hypothetical protein [Bacillus cereus]HDR8493503.1 hypothetical protein [Bacillus cereus]
MTTKNIIKPNTIHGPVKLPLKINNEYSDFNLWYFEFNGDRWVASIKGDIDPNKHIPLRIESACIFGHVFHSDKCDCGYQLDKALERIHSLGEGMVIYGIDQDARGLGIEAHFNIYVLRQLENLDTDGVYGRLNKPVDARSYDPVAFILNKFNIKKVLLLSNNRKRIKFLKENGFEVQNEKLEAPLTKNNMPTLMLEKEDLEYDFSFKTHGDWLKPIQDKVDGKQDVTIGRLVFETHKLLNEVTTDKKDQWGMAYNLYEEYGHEQQEQNSNYVAYSTDFPRIDELNIYKKMGVTTLVVPFAKIPNWLKLAGEEYGIHIQDWERKNKYQHDREQWNLVQNNDHFDVYIKDGKVRYLQLQGKESSFSLNRIKGLYQEDVFKYSSQTYLYEVQNKHCHWLEFELINEGTARQLNKKLISENNLILKKDKDSNLYYLGNYKGE